MAINDEVLKLVECSIPHNCCKLNGLKCVFCILNFNHIVEEPLELNCGHSICRACKPAEASLIFCKNDLENKPVGLSTSVAKRLVESVKDDLFVLLKHKYGQLIKILNGKLNILQIKRIFI